MQLMADDNNNGLYNITSNKYFIFTKLPERGVKKEPWLPVETTCNAY